MLHLIDSMLLLVIKYLYIRKMENKVFFYSKSLLSGKIIFKIEILSLHFISLRMTMS
jgi:hypothetical protein